MCCKKTQMSGLVAPVSTLRIRSNLQQTGNRLECLPVSQLVLPTTETERTSNFIYNSITNFHLTCTYTWLVHEQVFCSMSHRLFLKTLLPGPHHPACLVQLWLSSDLTNTKTDSLNKTAPDLSAINSINVISDKLWSGETSCQYEVEQQQWSERLYLCPPVFLEMKR